MKWAVLVLAAVLAMALGAVPAQARYLHMGNARPAAQSFLRWEAPAMGATSSALGRCWHSGPHAVQCSFTVTGVDVCDKSQDICELPLSGDPPPAHFFAVITQRRDGLYGKTLWLDSHSVWLMR